VPVRDLLRLPLGGLAAPRDARNLRAVGPHRRPHRLRAGRPLLALVPGPRDTPEGRTPVRLRRGPLQAQHLTAAPPRLWRDHLAVAWQQRVCGPARVAAGGGPGPPRRRALLPRHVQGVAPVERLVGAQEQAGPLPPHLVAAGVSTDHVAVRGQAVADRLWNPHNGQQALYPLAQGVSLPLSSSISSLAARTLQVVVRRSEDVKSKQSPFPLAVQGTPAPSTLVTRHQHLGDCRQRPNGAQEAAKSVPMRMARSGT
jgi:hypothetical protein